VTPPAPPCQVPNPHVHAAYFPVAVLVWGSLRRLGGTRLLGLAHLSPAVGSTSLRHAERSQNDRARTLPARLPFVCRTLRGSQPGSRVAISEAIAEVWQAQNTPQTDTHTHRSAHTCAHTRKSTSCCLRGPCPAAGCV